MAMICPSCGKSFEQQASCPTCALPLTHDSRPSSFDLSRPSSDWAGTPWAKMLIALLLAQGLYYALYYVYRGGIDALGQEDLFSLLVLQTLQMAAVTLGGVLAGAGQRSGLVNGAVLGLWNGAIFLVSDYFSGHTVSFVEMYSGPTLHSAFGALGGLIGGWAWPLPAEYRRPVARPPSSLTARRTIPKLLVKHVHWTRVVAGITIAVGGYFYADTILEFTRQMALVRTQRRSSLQDDAITWEIRALALLVGGAFSGACTFNGSIQGAWVGLASSILLTSGRLILGPVAALQSLLLTAGMSLILPFIGGWFGGKLLPPLLHELPKHRRVPH